MPPIDDTGQSGPTSGTPGSGEAKTTPSAEDAALAELQEQLEAEAAEGDLAEGQADGDDADDLEDGDKKARVPKWVKDGYLRHKDYTQKTMTAAEERKAVEAERAKIAAEAKFHREQVAEVAKLVTLDEQLAAYEKLDWDGLFAQNKEQHQYHQSRFQMLERQRNKLAGELQQKQMQKASETQQELAKRYETSLARIAKEIPNWSDETAGKLNAYAVDKGFTLEELQEHVLHPHRVSTIHKAYLYDQLMARTRAKAKQSDTPAAIQPVPTMTTRRSPGSPLPQDSDDIDTWVRKERQRVQKMRA